MLFTHDTECSLTAAAALVNTDGRNGEGLPDVAALDAFFVAHTYSGRHEHTEDELRAVRDLRPRLRRVWYADTETIVDIVNGLLRENDALPQLITHDDEPYHIHAVPRDAPLATRMAVEAAMALADLVRSGELGRLRICDHPDCENVLVDLSKNRSRRFCDAGCGNRAAVTAYRARKAASRD
ncbi:CGNR zinc finger domain-containing protein [Micromonospora peucetia]|uniref:Putative stress-induced transcription regulator n=1 Tax=Micromonospora peucetia TaxID=47871 RepID=A0A1C6V401_9ACTN|nr:CGNR zinc finger domain-containing protein [Micromonospora peucetia]MCX4389135.1 CGNR zinc finger domain-containing protein [Micromonospora peucetia]SCL61109.1 Putative stress-induced transcription regulator [Micromonospora peucetia]